VPAVGGRSDPHGSVDLDRGGASARAAKQLSAACRGSRSRASGKLEAAQRTDETTLLLGRASSSRLANMASQV